LSFEVLKQLLIEYPYSQNLHFLLAQKSKQESHPEFEQYLQRAATYMQSRSFLRQRLHAPVSVAPSQPAIEPEADEEPAQSATIYDETKNAFADTPLEDLPRVEFIPNVPVVDEAPNHLADIETTTPPIEDQTTANPPSASVSDIPFEIELPTSPDATGDNLINEAEKINFNLESDEPIFREPRIIRKRIIENNPPLPTVDHLFLSEEETDKTIPAAEDLAESLDLKKTDTPLYPLAVEVDDLDLENEVDLEKLDEVNEIEIYTETDLDEDFEDLLNQPLIDVSNIPKLQELDFLEEEADKVSNTNEENEIGTFPELEYDLNNLTEEEVMMVEVPKEKKAKDIKLNKWIKKYEYSKGRVEEKKKKKKKKKSKKKKKQDILESEPTISKKSKKKKKKKKSAKIKAKKKAIRAFAQRSIVENEEIASETLAELYIKQGSIQKGLDMFDRLSLIFPEKKAYFAARIKKLKKK